MNPNSITKWFFGSRKLYCPLCDDKSQLKKTIHIYGSVPFDEDYIATFNWDYDSDHKVFLLVGYGNKSPDGHDVLTTNRIITSIADIKNVCDVLNQNSYLIDEVRFIIDGCDNKCKFSHKYELKWLNNSNSLLLEEECVKLTKYRITNHYADNKSYITTSFNKCDTYDFDYILNIDLKNYKSLRIKIQQTLLLG